MTVGANASASVTFAPLTLMDASTHAVVRAGSDALPADNTFHVILSPSQPVSVLIVDSTDRGAASLYLTKALSIGTTPEFHTDVLAAERVTPDMLDKAAVVVLNGVPVPNAIAGGALKRYVERGGGLLVVFGERTTWPAGDADLLPGAIGGAVDRVSDQAGTLGFLDRSHNVFEIFKAPRSGDFSAAHIYRYRLCSRAPTIACSRASTMAAWRARNAASATAASSRGRRRSTIRGTIPRSARCTCRSCSSS